MITTTSSSRDNGRGVGRANGPRQIAGLMAVAAAGISLALAIGKVGLAPADPGPMTSVADAVRRDVQSWIHSQVNGLAEIGRRAAAHPRLKAALAARVDAATMVDLFATENWWRPFREQFRATRLVNANDSATLGHLDTAGEEQTLIEAARRAGASAGVVGLKGKPYLVTAARVGPAQDDHKSAPVVLLARPSDARWLSDFATEVQAGLMVTDGQAVLLLAGMPEIQTLLPSLAGVGSASALALDPEGRWSATRLDLAPGLQLWAMRALAGPAPSRAGIPPGLWWTASGLLTLIGLTILLRRPSPTEGTTQSFSAPAAMPGGLPIAAPGSGTDRVPVLSTFIETPASNALAVATAPLEAITSLEGKTFGRYRLVKKIADGGMSEIYRAVAFGPQGFSRTCIVKRLKPDLARIPEAVSQFIEEARVQASLVHSNIVPVFDFGNLDNEYFIAEEYIIGRDASLLSERCVEVTGAPMPTRIAYYIVCETLHALHFAHTLVGPEGRPLGIVHRDVSSMNIMVTASGDVKLFDFGIATSNHRVTRTQAGMIKGNAHFMSPEHARGQAVDARSDVFSVGLVLYFCLTNQALYSGKNTLEVLYQAARGPTEVEMERIAALPPPAAQLLAAALEVDPSRRFESAVDFAAALNPFAAGAKYHAAELLQGLFEEELRAETNV
jgi:hypothetical protein